MTPAMRTTFFGSIAIALACSLAAAGQDQAPAPGNAGQASQPATVGNAPGDIGTAATTAPAKPASETANTSTSAAQKPANAATAGNDDNPYDPVLEPPPLPKGKPTLVGGIATRVDHVRNRLVIAPFGGGQKLKLFVDERSHIYRDGTETTVLGIHKGDRVYADTMLDGSKIFARNVRVITEPGIAEVRGQVLASNPQRGTISLQDQLSAKPVTVEVSNATKYTSPKGDARASDIQPGSLIDVQFSPDRGNRDVAQEITILARPGDNYLFSGVITNLDMRSNTLAVENRSDDQTYELRFTPASLDDPRALKVGAEITARAVFDGKQYKASSVQVEKANSEQAGEQSKVQ